MNANGKNFEDAAAVNPVMLTARSPLIPEERRKKHSQARQGTRRMRIQQGSKAVTEQLHRTGGKHTVNETTKTRAKTWESLCTEHCCLASCISVHGYCHLGVACSGA